MKATLHVRPEGDDPKARPAKDRVQKAASALSKEGFDVLHVGRFGVSVSSDQEKFARVLGVDVKAGKVVQVAPQHEELKDLVDILQVDSEPEYFG